jgi:DNA-binding CsgD family transcriptional regulator
MRETFISQTSSSSSHFLKRLSIFGSLFGFLCPEFNFMAGKGTSKKGLDYLVFGKTVFIPFEPSIFVLDFRSLLRFLFFFVFGFIFWSCHQKDLPELESLDKEFSQREVREYQKKERIIRLEKQLNSTQNQGDKIEILSALCQEYKSYAFDSAHKKSQQLLEISRKGKNPCQIVKSQIEHAYVQLSAGIINPALDSLFSYKPGLCDSSVQSDYFFTLSKAYYELGTINPENEQIGLFIKKGNDYLDSALIKTQAGSLQFESLLAYKTLKANDLQKAKVLYESLLKKPDLPTRQLAKESACLASIYEASGDKENAIRYYAQSAMADEASSVREYASLIRLANLLFERGDIERSNLYITLSLKDANFFGSIQRKIQILEVLPLIKAQQLILVKEKESTWLFFSVLLFILLVGCIYLVFLSIRQNRKIRKNEKRLADYNLELEKNKEELEEAQIIKEQYIGHFFQGNTRIINKIEKIFGEIEKANQEKNQSDIRFQISQFKPDIEKKKLLKDFDLAFLSIFPTFVEEVNELMAENHQFAKEETHSLSNELRIIALMRLGLNNNELIARSLGYSVNTVYTYKTKIRNRSILSSEDFDKAILKIQSSKAGSDSNERN